MTLLKQLVFGALDRAKENGYEFTDYKMAAEDLVDYDADLENYHPDELMPHVEAWFQQDERKRS